VNLIPFSKQSLRLNGALPFSLRDIEGKLLLAAGTKIDGEETLNRLRKGELYVDETETGEWKRRLGAAMDIMMLQNASLRQITQVRPLDEAAKPRPPVLAFGDQWGEMVVALHGALRDIRSEGSWPQRLAAMHQRALGLADTKSDASLYWLIYHAGHSFEYYSSHHALLCMVVARITAQVLQWPAALLSALEQAALTMNVSMLRQQDQLATVGTRVNPKTRADILSHPERSAGMLADAGVTNRALIEIVRLHHDDGLKHTPLATLDPVQRAARLLRRVDIFTAKLSRRQERRPMTPMQAAREACLGAEGVPDEIGAALLKAVGIYPPGSYVALHSGEIGIVISRGQRANWPIVATLIGADGTPLGSPLIHDTSDRRYGIKSSISATTVKVVPPHEQLMSRR
jgi:HD-GYP domain-containing protein (c-di-GMP phosphodiesterase class II)